MKIFIVSFNQTAESDYGLGFLLIGFSWKIPLLFLLLLSRTLHRSSNFLHAFKAFFHHSIAVSLNYVSLPLSVFVDSKSALASEYCRQHCLFLAILSAARTKQFTLFFKRGSVPSTKGYWLHLQVEVPLSHSSHISVVVCLPSRRD